MVYELEILISHRAKQEDTKILATIQNFRRRAGKVQTKAKTANTSGPVFYDDVGVA